MSYKSAKFVSICTFSTLVMLGVAGCGEKQRAKTLYNVLMEIASDGYTKTKGNSANKIEGISSCLIRFDSIDYYAYTENSVIRTSIALNIENEEEDLEQFVLDYQNKKIFEVEFKFGKRVIDETIENAFYDKVLDSRNPGADPMYVATEEMKLVSFVLDDDLNHVTISCSCKNGTGDYLSLNDLSYNIEDKKEDCSGSSDIYRKKERPVLYSLMSNYIVK